MKALARILLLMLLMLAISETANAQLRYGFRFGGDISAAKLKNVDGFELKNGSGFAGGLVLEYQFTKCGFAPDIAVEYGRHNVRLQPTEGDPHGFGRNFIDVPLRFKYKFWIKATKYLFGPMVYTGPVFSFRLDHGDAYPLSTKTFQPGWEAGIGVDVINFLQLSAGYRFGLGNSVKEFAGFPDASLRTDGWRVGATLLFDF